MVNNNLPYKTYFLEKYLKDNSINTAEVKNIIEIGAQDCTESVKFTELFPNAYITAFECNPRLIELCEFNALLSDRIKVVEKMVTDKPWNKTFYMPDDQPGMGSMKKCLFSGSSTTVETVRMDDYLGDEVIDLLWVDVQGAEVDILNSFGKKLDNVRTIYVEVNILPMRYYQSSTPAGITRMLQYRTIKETYLVSNNEVHMILT